MILFVITLRAAMSGTYCGGTYCGFNASTKAVLQMVKEHIAGDEFIVVYKVGSAVKQNFKDQPHLIAQYSEPSWHQRSIHDRCFTLERDSEVPNFWHHQQLPFALVDFVTSDPNMKLFIILVDPHFSDFDPVVMDAFQGATGFWSERKKFGDGITLALGDKVSVISFGQYETKKLKDDLKISLSYHKDFLRMEDVVGNWWFSFSKTYHERIKRLLMFSNFGYIQSVIAAAYLNTKYRFSDFDLKLFDVHMKFLSGESEIFKAATIKKVIERAYIIQGFTVIPGEEPAEQRFTFGFRKPDGSFFTLQRNMIPIYTNMIKDFPLNAMLDVIGEERKMQVNVLMDLRTWGVDKLEPNDFLTLSLQVEMLDF